MQIVRFRSALDWMIAHPDWEVAFSRELTRLDYKGGRQGISMVRAMRSLPIENKSNLVKNCLKAGLAIPSQSEAKRLARYWGVTNFKSRSDLSRPSAKDWHELQQAVLVRLNARHQTYKANQSEVYGRFHQLPVQCALEYCSIPNLKEDACQEARIALLEAIDRIDPTENFEAYARVCLRRRIRNVVMKDRIPVKAPINLLAKTFQKRHVQHTALAKAIREGVVRLDDDSSLESSLASQELIAAEGLPRDLATQSDDTQFIGEAMAKLTGKQREVLELRFGLTPGTPPMTLSQVGERSGISRQQVFQRERRAINKLQTLLSPLIAERGNLGAKL